MLRTADHGEPLGRSREVLTDRGSLLGEPLHDLGSRLQARRGQGPSGVLCPAQDVTLLLHVLGVIALIEEAHLLAKVSRGLVVDLRIAGREQMSGAGEDGQR